MSHVATGWAVKQRGLKPITRIVLWLLCDVHNTHNGCFPSQERLAKDAEISRSTLNVHLDILESLALIRREVSRHPQNKRQERTRYFFSFEDEEDEEEEFGRKAKPSPESGHGAESGFSAKPSPEKRKSRVRELPDSNQEEEPVREPVKERTPESPKKPPDYFEQFWTEYPKRAGSNPRALAEKSFGKAIKAGASPADVLQGVRAYADEQAKLGKLGTIYVAQAATWLNQKRWEDYVNAKPEPAVDIEVMRKRYNAMPAGPDRDAFGKRYFSIARA